MATQLNIKDARTVQRVRELARERGEPVTATLRSLVDREWQAREEQLQRKIDANLRVMREIQEEVRRVTPPETARMTLKEIMDSIYDDGEPDGFAR